MSDNKNFSSLPDEDLVLLAQTGNNEAMEIVISRYKNSVYAIASGYYMAGFDKDDIAQEGMIGLYRAILDYKPGKSSFKTFSALCVTRKIISVLKSSKRQKNIALNSSLSLDNELASDSDNQLIYYLHDLNKTNPENIIISNENIKNYEVIIRNSLTKLEFDVFNLHKCGMSYKDIAKTLKKDLKSIDNAIQRIKKKLLCITEFDN